jgi:hypothetical protein
VVARRPLAEVVLDLGEVYLALICQSTRYGVVFGCRCWGTLVAILHMQLFEDAAFENDGKRMVVTLKQLTSYVLLLQAHGQI